MPASPENLSCLAQICSRASVRKKCRTSPWRRPPGPVVGTTDPSSGSLDCIGPGVPAWDQGGAEQRCPKTCSDWIFYQVSTGGQPYLIDSKTKRERCENILGIFVCQHTSVCLVGKPVGSGDLDPESKGSGCQGGINPRFSGSTSLFPTETRI